MDIYRLIHTCIILFDLVIPFRKTALGESSISTEEIIEEKESKSFNQPDIRSY